MGCSSRKLRAPPHKIPEIKWKLRERGWDSIFSCLDPELRHNTGGLAALCRTPFRVYKMAPMTTLVQKLVTGGRLQLLGMDLGSETPLLLFNIYGWTGARQDDMAASRTDAIIAAIEKEVEKQPPGPMAIAGDLNSSVERLPSLQHLMNTHSWIDVGARASFFGGTDCQTTCMGPNASEATRNDYFICNPLLFCQIAKFPG